MDESEGKYLRRALPISFANRVLCLTVFSFSSIIQTRFLFIKGDALMIID
jgi:hypothetical protein